mgnify:CR=1 FL=1
MFTTHNLGSQQSTTTLLRTVIDEVTELEPGGGLLFLATGPAGSGKSSLVREIARSLPGWSGIRVTALSWQAGNDGQLLEHILQRAGHDGSLLVDVGGDAAVGIKEREIPSPIHRYGEQPADAARTLHGAAQVFSPDVVIGNHAGCVGNDLLNQIPTVVGEGMRGCRRDF